MIDKDSGLTDRQLVEAAKANPDHFGGLVNRYWNRLFCYIRRTTYFSQEDIEDILQEVFIKVYRFLNDYDDSMSFSTWIYQISRNSAIDAIRKKKARPETVHLETEELIKVLSSGLNIEKEIVGRDSLEKIREIIEKLPFNYREVLILRFLEDKDYEEIMDILKMPKGTIASLINRGRKMIVEEAKKQNII